jgi:hypothetical protein
VSITDFLGRLIDALERAGVPYMLAGSFASSFHGEPRTTQDVDLVIHTDAAGIRRLVSGLPASDYYVDLDTALNALKRLSQFNVIDMNTGWKADLIPRKPRPFSRSEFDRRQRVDIDGLILWVAAPEDVVISKLEWASKTGSTRQLRDVEGIIRAKRTPLDFSYIDHWVADLGLTREWRAVHREPPDDGDSSSV